MADQCIGRLTLNTKQIDESIKHVNDKLKELGVGIKVDLSKNVSGEVKKQLDGVLKEIEQYEKKMSEAVDKAINNAESKAAKKSDDKNLKEAIALWKEYYSLMTKAQNASNAGRSNQADYYKKEAEALVQNVQALKERAEQTEAVARAMRSYHAAIEAGADKQAANDAKMAAQAQKELAKEIESSARARQRASEIANKQELQDEANVIEALIDLYRRKAQMDTEATKSVASGNVANANLYIQEEQAIQKTIDAIAKLYPELDKVAQADDRVAEAELRRQAATNSAKQKAEELDYKQKTEDINNYANALTSMLNEQAKFNQQVASGKLTEGSEQYSQAEEKLRHLESAAIQAGQKLDQAGREAAMGMQEVKTAMDNVNISAAAINDASQISPLNQIERAYNQLTIAIREYNIAKKSDNQEGMTFWQNQINGAMQVVGLIEKEVNTLNVDEATRARILELINRAKTEQRGFEKGITDSTTATREWESQLNSILMRYLSITAVIRMMTSLIRNTVEYVAEFSDKMNEIQMITLATDAEIERLANTYRQIAYDMNVSTLDMADAAIYFTRQGLAAEEVESRLRSTTMYAKAANIEFTVAAELITAVVNSMGLMEQEAEDGRDAAQRVADVFLAVGDSAATSGAEIGEAMQKAAAAAGTFGVSFEWLAAYIATVSETTRQEARTIGTALNTIIARLHSIRSSGYNNEDETKINDVAKALATINVALLDQEGNWRDMTDIFNDIAKVWTTLDGKQKSYIATTMAGVKQQNVFLALMNDLSKGIENGSRAWELYNIAMGSAGTAAEKYDVYLDSVAASQERLNLAQEKFYSILSDTVVKNFYDWFAHIVDVFADGTKALGGLNIILPVTIGLVAGLAVAFKSAGGAMAFFANHPVILTLGLIITGVVALTTAVGAFDQAIHTSAERFDEANRAITAGKENLTSYLALQNKTNAMFLSFGDATNLTAEDLAEYNGLLDQLAKISPKAEVTVGLLRQGLIDQKTAAEDLNGELEKLIENEQKAIMMAGIDKYANWGASPEDSDVIKTLIKLYDNEDINNDINPARTIARVVTPGQMESWTLPKGVNGIDIPQELKDYAKKSFEATGDWGVVSQMIWYKYFGTYDTSMSPSEAIADRVNQEIDNVMDLVSFDMTPAQKAAARASFADMLFGSDGHLSAEEYAAFGTKASKFISTIMNHGFEGLNLSPEFVVQGIAESLFGASDWTKEVAAIYRKLGDDAAYAFIDGYNELVEAGFSSEIIRSVMDGLDESSWVNIVQEMRDTIMQNLESVFGDIGPVEELLNNVDIKTLRLISELANEDYLNTSDIARIWEESEGDMAIFSARILEIAKSHNIDAEATEEDAKSIATLVEEIKAASKEIKSMTDIINALKNGETVSLDNILDLASAHPEILAVIHDGEQLLATLEAIRKEKVDDTIGGIKQMMLDSNEVFMNSPFAYLAEEGITTLGQIYDTNTYGEAVHKYVDQSVAMMLSATGQFANVGNEWIGALTESMFSNSNVDLMNRKAIEASELVAKGWKDAGEGIATVFSTSYTAGDKTKGAGLAWNRDVVVTLTPILPDGTVLTPEEMDKYMEELLAGTTSTEGLLTLDDTENGGMGLIIDVTDVINGDFAAAIANVEQMTEVLHQMQEVLYGKPDEEKSWLEKQVEAAEKAAELDWAKSNGYIEQLGMINRALDEGPEAALAVWNSFDAEMQSALADTYPGVISALYDIEKGTDDFSDSADKATKSTNRLSRELEKAGKYATAKYFKDSWKAIQDVEKGTISATDAYSTFWKEVDKVGKAYEDILDVNDKLSSSTQVTVQDVSNLSTVLGLSAEEILADWPAALEMFDDLIAEGGEMSTVFDELNKAAFIRITGTSEADFSNIENGLFAVRSDAEDVIKLLEATGQWEIADIDLPQEAKVWDPVSGDWLEQSAVAKATVLRAKGDNPFSTWKNKNPKSGKGSGSGSGSGGGGGGGGGGGNKSNGMTEVERMLDRMSQINAIQESQQNFYQAQNKYYSGAGMLQGVIAYSQQEINVLKEQNKTLQSNIDQIEYWLDVKRKELASLDITDERYEEVADDVDKLQKAHQTYTKQLVENSTAIDSLNNAIDETKKKIRTMEIDLRDTIRKAIEDRERRTEDMLNGEIEMENKILDLIKKRYEKERDQIINTTNMKIEALQKERDLLDEQLQLRREQAEEEDKANELAQYELQYQRIMADPTRRKEALEIQKKITDLREEMAWDAAEKEVKAQQDSIDQQITSLEDYIQYVEEYYEDLFEHPVKLIEEMKGILTRTDEEIIEWLKTNDEEFAKSTENTQKKMVDGWQDTLNQMRGIIETHWAEVEEIISRGDDYIIEFLKENSADYAEAGKLQAEAYVDEWMKKLEDLRKAYMDVQTLIAPDYDYIAPTDEGGSGSGGGGGGGGSGGGGGGNDDTTGLTDVIESAASVLASGGAKLNKSIIDPKTSMMMFDSGGIARGSGVAFVHDKERILNPYQTDLFETMVQALESMSTIMMPSMPNYGGLQTGTGTPVSVGDININVDNLDTDDDYEEMAEKVTQIIMERIGRTAVVGGLRISSV